jgi:DNA-binding transcriptional regulator YiaG
VKIDVEDKIDLKEGLLFPEQIRFIRERNEQSQEKFTEYRQKNHTLKDRQKDHTFSDLAIQVVSIL